jgi:hypothetical protein
LYLRCCSVRPTDFSLSNSFIAILVLCCFISSGVERSSAAHFATGSALPLLTRMLLLFVFDFFCRMLVGQLPLLPSFFLLGESLCLSSCRLLCYVVQCGCLSSVTVQGGAARGGRCGGGASAKCSTGVGALVVCREAAARCVPACGGGSLPPSQFGFGLLPISSNRVIPGAICWYTASAPASSTCSG